MSGTKWGADDPDDDVDLNLAGEPDREIPDRYSSVDAAGDLCIYDKEFHQAWVQSSVGVRLDDCR